MAGKEPTKKRRKWPIVLLVILLLLGAAVMAAPHIAYNVAVTRMEAGEYDTAQSIFAVLGDFQDSGAQLEKIETIRTYDNAVGLMESGNYDAACTQFQSLGAYQDSAELLTECTYRKAVSLLHYGPDTDYEKIDQAREIFLSLGDYGESEAYLSQFRRASISLSRAYLQSGEDLGAEPLWYDAQGRLTGRGSVLEQYAYDEEGRLIYDAPDHIEYDEEGRISVVSNEERVVSYTYDKKGNEISRSYYYIESQRTRSRPVRYERKYSGDLLVKETFYDNEMLWTVNLYTYDDQGYLTEHTVQTYGGKPYSSDQTYQYAYHEDGTLDRTTYLYPEAERCYTETCIYGYIWAPNAE